MKKYKLTKATSNLFFLEDSRTPVLGRLGSGRQSHSLGNGCRWVLGLAYLHTERRVRKVGQSRTKEALALR
jgi:hypothetical protein